MSDGVAHYCMDTSCFIDMALYQPRDVFPGLWTNLRAMVDDGSVLIHRMVREEVLVKDDDAAGWMKEIPLDLLIEIDGAQAAFVGRMGADWQHLRYLYQQPAYEKKADPFLIATGAVRGCCVVTNEGRREWKIPDICARYQVKSMNHLQFVREMRWTF